MKRFDGYEIPAVCFWCVLALPIAALIFVMAIAWYIVAALIETAIYATQDAVFIFCTIAGLDAPFWTTWRV